MTTPTLWTAESVTEGHPDKVADQHFMDIIFSTKMNHHEVSMFLAPSFFLSTLRVVKYRYSVTNHYDGRIGTPHNSIGYVLKGQAVFTSDREHFELGSGEMVYVPRGERYVSAWSGSPDIEYCSAHFLFNPLDQANDDVSTMRRYTLQKIRGGGNAMQSVFDELYTAYSEGGNSMFTTLGKFYLLYRGIVETLVDEELPVTKNPVQAAIKYIESHLTQDFYVADLAALCNMSESRFYKAFQHLVGCTPIDYKNRVRIQYAVELLSEHDNTVEKISNLLNFSSPAYFRRIFKQVTGKTPHESRYSL